MSKFIHNNMEVEYIRPFSTENLTIEKCPRYYYSGEILGVHYWMSEVKAEDIILTSKNLEMVGRVIPQFKQVKTFTGDWIRKPYEVIYK